LFCLVEDTGSELTQKEVASSASALKIKEILEDDQLL
jgi:hypothetical protein